MSASLDVVLIGLQCQHRRQCGRDADHTKAPLGIMHFVAPSFSRNSMVRDCHIYCVAKLVTMRQQERSSCVHRPCFGNRDSMHVHIWLIVPLGYLEFMRSIFLAGHYDSIAIAFIPTILLCSLSTEMIYFSTLVLPRSTTKKATSRLPAALTASPTCLYL